MQLTEMLSLIVKGFWETLYMTLGSTLVAYAIGLPLGLLLILTDPQSLKPRPVFNRVMGVVINLLRSVPFIILLVSIPSAIINFYYRKKNVLYMRFRSKDRRQMDYYSNLMTNKDVVKEIRLFNLSDLFIGRYKDIFKNYFAGIKKIIWAQGVSRIFLFAKTSFLHCRF